MSREDTLNMPYNEMVDLITCLNIYNGDSYEVIKPTYDEVIAME